MMDNWPSHHHNVLVRASNVSVGLKNVRGKNITENVKKNVNRYNKSLVYRLNSVSIV